MEDEVLLSFVNLQQFVAERMDDPERDILMQNLFQIKQEYFLFFKNYS